MRAGTPPRARRGPTAAHARRGSRLVVPIAAQGGVLADPVHARRLGRVEATQLLDLAARARLEPSQPVGDAVRDGGVVADVEVEVAERLERAPVATVEHARLLHVEGAGDDPVPPPRDD